MYDDSISDQNEQFEFQSSSNDIDEYDPVKKNETFTPDLAEHEFEEKIDLDVSLKLKECHISKKPNSLSEVKKQIMSARGSKTARTHVE